MAWKMPQMLLILERKEEKKNLIGDINPLGLHNQQNLEMPYWTNTVCVRNHFLVIYKLSKNIKINQVQNNEYTAMQQTLQSLFANTVINIKFSKRVRDSNLEKKGKQ